MNKITDLERFAQVGILFVAIAIILSVGADVIQNSQDNFKYYVKDTPSVYDTNKVLNVTTSLILSKQNVTSGSIVIRNVTGNVLVSSGNYTVEYATGNVTAVIGNWTSVNVTFTYDAYETTSVDVMKNATNATAELSSWLPTIALVIAASLLIGLIAMYFRRKQ